MPTLRPAHRPLRPRGRLLAVSLWLARPAATGWRCLPVVARIALGGAIALALAPAVARGLWQAWLLYGRYIDLWFGAGTAATAFTPLVR